MMSPAARTRTSLYIWGVGVGAWVGTSVGSAVGCAVGVGVGWLNTDIDPPGINIINTTTTMPTANSVSPAVGNNFGLRR